MNRIELEEFDISTISEVEPKYDLKSIAGGYFRIHTNTSGLVFNMSMSNVINHKLEQEEKEGVVDLFEFIANNFKELTISHAVADLYDLGFPVDEWVINYISHLNKERKNYSAMLSLLAALQDFGDDDKNL
tara:strand:+ start:16222 stop:16614 length:393 start_codon:yes stop_codon:yes gene_type:complete